MSVSICHVQKEAAQINCLSEKISHQLDSCHPNVCHIEKELCHLDALLEKLGCNLEQVCAPSCEISAIECNIQKAECLDGTLHCELSGPPCEINWCDVHATDACLQSTTAEIWCETNSLSCCTSVPEAA
jgi:hypothetical protein